MTARRTAGGGDVPRKVEVRIWVPVVTAFISALLGAGLALVIAVFPFTSKLAGIEERLMTLERNVSRIPTQSPWYTDEVGAWRERVNTHVGNQGDVHHTLTELDARYATKDDLNQMRLTLDTMVGALGEIKGSLSEHRKEER